MASGVAFIGSKLTDARPRASETFAERTPGTPFIARSTWATQLAQSIPLTEKSADVEEASITVSMSKAFYAAKLGACVLAVETGASRPQRVSAARDRASR